MTNKWMLATVRHGQTDFNVEKRYAGTIDVPLNEAGWADARNASKALSSYGFDIIICSPLKRAQQTVQGFFDGKVQPIISQLIHERNYGVMQGLTEVEIEELRPPVHFIKAGNDFHSVDPLRGETLEEVSVRARAFLDSVLEKYCGKNILVVSHGQFLQQLHGVIRGQDWIQSLIEPVRNLELSLFEFSNRELLSETRASLATRVQINW